ncbi:MAG: hypothetical protein Q8R01_06240 [Ramlibacter sp.]|nr:hypothetical protein [Ramlibacter sp.]
MTQPSAYALLAATTYADIRERVENQAPMPTSLGFCGVSPHRPIVGAPLCALQTTGQKKPLRMLLVLIAAFHLAACSKTVQWEEEVELSSGEILWVKRTDSFKRTSEPGNPLQSAWWPTRRALEFTWHGQRYEFDTDTTSIMMLYEVEVSKSMAIVAWTKKCAKPGYGEFRRANGDWHLQPTVSAAIVGKPRNLMGFYSAVPGQIPARATIKFKRDSHFELPQKGGEETHLQESRVANNCSGGK